MVLSVTLSTLQLVAEHFFFGKAGGMSGTETRSFKFIGGLSSDTACSGFNISVGSNNLATATIRTYAIKAG